MYSILNIEQIITQNGVPNAHGKFYVYRLGRTELADIFYDPNGATPLPNPVDLDNLGMGVVYVSNLYNYTVVCCDAYNNEIFSRDIYPDAPGSGGTTKTYNGVYPIVVDNQVNAISASQASLGVQEPLYFVEDSNSATVIGIHESAVTNLPYVENSALGYDTDGNISGISGSGLNALVADYSKTASYAYTSDYSVSSESATWANSAVHDRLGRDIVDTYLTGVPDEYATKDFVISAVDSAVSGKYDTSSFSAISGDFLNKSGLEYEDGKITGYSGSAFSAGKVYSGISPVIVDNDNDTISVESATLGVQAPLYLVEDSESATIIGVSGLQPSGDYIERSAIQSAQLGNYKLISGLYDGAISAKLADYASTAYSAERAYSATIAESASASISADYATNGWLSGRRGSFDEHIPVKAYFVPTGKMLGITVGNVYDFNANSADSAGYAVSAKSATYDSMGRSIVGTYVDNITYSGLYDTVSANSAMWAKDYSAGNFIDITDDVISVTGFENTDSMGIGEGLYIDASGNLCASATGGANYSAGDHIDITDNTISVTGTEEADSMGIGEHLYIDGSGNLNVSATETDSMGIGEGLYIDNSGNLCASATGGANYSAGEHIDITDDTISVTGVEETDSMGIGEGLYIDGSGNLCASATGGANYSAGAFIDITDNVISVTDTAEADSLGLGEHLYIDNSGNIDVSAVEASALGIGEGLYIDNSGNLCASGIPTSASEAIDAVTANSAQWAQSGTDYSATAPIYIDSGNIGISAKDFNLTAPLVMTEDASAVNITVSAKDFEVQSPLYLTESNSAVSMGISGILYESGFGYDSNLAISGYNGSAFAGGGGGGISTVTTDSSMTGNGSVASPLGISYPLTPSNNESTATFNQYGMSINDGNGMRGVTYGSIGRWDETHDTVSANSGAWGGSALPISAGQGVKFDIVNNTLVASTDETVLWSGVGSTTGSTINLSESLTHFEKYGLYYYIPYQETNQTYYQEFMYKQGQNVFGIKTDGINSTIWRMYCDYGTMTDTSISLVSGRQGGVWLTASPQEIVWYDGSDRHHYITKVIGINRIVGGN